MVQFLPLLKNIGFILIGIVFNNDYYKEEEGDDGDDDKGNLI